MKSVRRICAGASACCILLAVTSTAQAQSGLRESLERLDRNENGTIEPDEITPLSRPYLERVAKSRRMSLDRPNDIDKLQEAARIYFAVNNGVADERVRADVTSSVRPFGPSRDEVMVPEFGLSQYKYPYTRDDLEEADDTLAGYDRNRDGFLDRREALRVRWTHRDPFLEDLDKDNRLSRLELAQRYARRRLVTNDSDELIQRSRRVGNGIEPSRKERDEPQRNRWWERGSRYYLTATVLGRFDANRNGRLEPSETKGLGFPAGSVDIDRDGVLSRQELDEYLTELQERAGASVEGLPTWFFERDQNGDSQVSMSEFTEEWSDSLLAEFIALDMNDDGLLTAEEVVSSSAIVGGDYRNTDAVVLPPRQSAISEINVDQHMLIGDVNVQLSITHSYLSHLDIYLVGPGGERIELCTAVGGGDDHFNQTIFDDQASTPITKGRAPFEGSFLPEGRLKGQPSLSTFNDKDAFGTWQLVVSGSRSERFGMLNSWSMTIRPQDLMPGQRAELASAAETSAAEARASEANALVASGRTASGRTASGPVSSETPASQASAVESSRSQKTADWGKWSGKQYDSEDENDDAAEARQKKIEQYRAYIKAMKEKGESPDLRKVDWFEKGNR